MAIMALADLHLSSEADKPMDIFGPEWENHTVKIGERWKEVVNENDLVIIPGDISWAMHLSEAVDDLDWLANLPGGKLLIRGNHDYWWDSLAKVRKALPPGIHVLQNDFFHRDGWAVCGSRGWICPGDSRFDPEKDNKIYLRELQRLELSLKSAYDAGFRNIIAAMHFPPFNVTHEPSGFTRLLNEYGVKICVYGHLHAKAGKHAFEGEMNGTGYIFVSADHLDFTPALIV